MGDIGKLERVPLREVWKHEAQGLTRWLEENIDVVSERLGFRISNAERESAAGDFNVDLLAQDDAGNFVIIENQLERSDHDHLGKIITYLAAVDAKTAVWIVAEPRQEHVDAISWLNKSRLADFYLLRIEAVRIGESSPAPLLTLIGGPSEETREAVQNVEESAERMTATILHRFWENLLEKAKKQTRLHAAVRPGRESWVGAGAGIGGLSFTYGVRQHDGYVELYIDRGKEAHAWNREIFDALHDQRAAIEEVFGGALRWDRPPEARFCRVRATIDVGGWRDNEDRWPQIHEAMVDAMVRLHGALQPWIDKLKR